MKSIRRLLGTGLLLCCATAADAQRVRLHGRVLDDASQQPIVGATVVLVDADGGSLARQITDESGEFGFEVAGNGAVRLRAERIGYRRVTTPVLQFDGYTMFRVELRLSVAAVLLAPLTVVARSGSDVSPTLAGFARRRDSGIGWFITREQIEQRNPARVTDLLRTVPGVRIQPSRGHRIVYMSRVAACPAQIYIDGFHINRPMPTPSGRRGRPPSEVYPVDEMVHPSSIEGIEVYQGLSRVPAEFHSPEAKCGVVAIWTRRGS